MGVPMPPPGYALDPGPGQLPAGFTADQAAPAPAPKKDQLLGLELGIKEPLDHWANLLETGLNKAGLDTDAIDKFFGSKTTAQVITDRKAEVAKLASQGTVPGATGKFVGNVAATAPALFEAPIVGGLEAGAILSDKSDPLGIATDAAKSAVAGKVLGTVGSKVAGLIAPKMAPAADLLTKAGVKLTPGQMAGGALKTVEDKATSVPILGDIITAARRRGYDQFNRAAFNRALAPLGETVPSGIQPGHDMVNYVEGKIGGVFDDVLSHVTAKPDSPFLDKLNKMVPQLGSLPAPQVQQFRQIISNYVLDPLSKGMDGRAAQMATSELGRLSRGYSGSASFAERELGSALSDVREHFLDLIERQNAYDAPVLAKAREAWANFIRPQKAAASIGAEEGKFTPAQLASAVRATDQSVRKGAYARGSALMQDLSDAGKSRLPSKYPDSGTAGRLNLSNPIQWPSGVFGGLSGLALLPAYTRAGQDAVSSFLSPSLARQAAAKRIAPVLERGGRAVAAPLVVGK